MRSESIDARTVVNPGGLVDSHCPTCNQRIIAPFAGSGTTLLAALAAGHQVIGIEMVPAIFVTARNRIAAEWARVGPADTDRP